MDAGARAWFLSAVAGLGALLVHGIANSDQAEQGSNENRVDALYNRFCVPCHGQFGDGRGPAAPYVWPRPRNFSAGEFRYKTTPVQQLPSLEDLTTTIRDGVDGTSMPGFHVALSERDMGALAHKVRGFATAQNNDNPLPRPRANRAVNGVAIPPQAIAADNESKKTRGGYWFAHGLTDEQGLFGTEIALQGKPPKVFTPAQSTQSAEQCARCHNQQFGEWRNSFHSSATAPGVLAQLVQFNAKGQGAVAESCQRCHNPLAEQHELLRREQGGRPQSDKTYAGNPRFDDELRSQGVNCASCHMRGWRRFGPPNPSASLLRMPNYPLADTEQLYTQLEIYERSDFCLPCHQLTPRLAVNGKPLLNTYKEWLEGPYMRRGVQCQHCHMPNREHTWKGVHDKDTFLQGVRLDAVAVRSAAGVVNVWARLHNIGAGHFLPTTPTPAAWLRIDLVDDRGAPIAGAGAEMRIGRHIEFNKKWIEHEDTRIPPGEARQLAKAWKNGRVAEAIQAKIAVRVHPDDFYEGFYRGKLKGKLDPTSRRLYGEALERALAARYQAVERLIPIVAQ